MKNMKNERVSFYLSTKVFTSVAVFAAVKKITKSAFIEDALRFQIRYIGARSKMEMSKALKEARKVALPILEAMNREVKKPSVEERERITVSLNANLLSDINVLAAINAESKGIFIEKSIGFYMDYAKKRIEREYFRSGYNVDEILSQLEKLSEFMPSGDEPFTLLSHIEGEVPLTRKLSPCKGSTFLLSPSPDYDVLVKKEYESKAKSKSIDVCEEDILKDDSPAVERSEDPEDLSGFLWGRAKDWEDQEVEDIDLDSVDQSLWFKNV